MSVTLYARSATLDEFFERFEAFIGSLDSKLRVSVGSIGSKSARFLTEPAGLTSQKRYLGYKQEALQVGGALMTSISIEQDGRSIDFRMSEWASGSLPVEFDPKMVHRPWLSSLARCFELSTRPPEPTTGATSLGRDSDAASYEAIRHFEQATASVAKANEEGVAAAKAFFADATQELTRQTAAIRSELDAERRERRQMFERHLAESDSLDVREHAAVRRELLERLEALADSRAKPRRSDTTDRVGRRLTAVCFVTAFAGVCLASAALIGVPVAARPRLQSWGLGWAADWLVQDAVWATGLVPEILLASGMLLLLLAVSVWMRRLGRVLRRSERDDDISARFREDLLRMSWVGELFVEAADKQRVGEDLEAVLPPVLIERFTHGLFGSSSRFSRGSPQSHDTAGSDRDREDRDREDHGREDSGSGEPEGLSDDVEARRWRHAESGSRGRPLPVSHRVDSVGVDSTVGG